MNPRSQTRQRLVDPSGVYPTMWATLRKGGCVGLRRPASTGEAVREAEAEDEAEAGEGLNNAGALL